MKNILSFLLPFAILISGCSQEELRNNLLDFQDAKSFTATLEQDQTRTYVEDGYLRWTAGDQISLFDGNTLNRQYKFDGETGENSGTFSIVSKPFGTGNDLSCHYAVYPYASDVKITESGVITTTLPAEQSYAENSFGLGANTMVAVTKDLDDTFLKFKNVSGYLKLQLYGDDVTVKSITLTGNNNEKLAGPANITHAYGDEPKIIMSEEATASIILNCGAGVKIGTTIESATVFWITVPPVTFEDGFTITIKDSNGEIFTKSTINEIKIERNIIHRMAFLKVALELVDIPYITFDSEIKQTFTMSEAVESLEYSIKGGKWTELGTNIITFGGNAGNLRLRGKSLIGTATDTDNYSQIKFGELNGNVSCSGDIRTLLDYENHASVNTSQARFCRLFGGCYGLIEAPKLPATVLADYCYYSMFNTCINLANAPELPATILTKSCYSNMFAYCESLTSTPYLPAKSLAEDCYAFMFRNCINLRKTFDLTATTLAVGCYRSMFRACVNLEVAPDLSGIILAESCCNAMFYSCTNLKKAPNLPATTLADGCYAIMFAACKNLTTAPKLPATTLAPSCYYLMFTGAGLTDAPELPATSLESLCYHSMFRGCKSLEVAPILPATTLSTACYGYMFMDCLKLKNITMLATDISAGDCLGNWVSGVASEGIFTKAKDMASLTEGNSGIPSGWIVKDEE